MHQREEGRAVREGIFDHGYFSPGKSSEENSKNT
jgi:hypothetical protein